MQIMANPCDIWFRIFVVVFVLISSGTLLWLVSSFIFNTFFKGGNFWQHHQQRTIDIQSNKIQDLEQKLSECNDENNI